MGWLSELVEERGAEALDLHAQTINPQFVRLLRAIGFDRRWARAEGAYLWDSDGNRYLDVLGGFGMFNVGRNNPRIREALVGLHARWKAGHLGDGYLTDDERNRLSRKTRVEELAELLWSLE